jgi:hypothetical protein
MRVWPWIGTMLLAAITAASALGGSGGTTAVTGGATSQAVPRPASGSYSGRNSQNGNGATLFVPAGATSVVNFSIPAVNLVCKGGGGGGVTDHIWVLKAAIKSRVFATKTTQVGVVGFARAKFTYTVSGRFQGTRSAGSATATGSYREDITFPDVAGRTCTSNVQTWTATRATQPAPTGAIAPGNYSGRNSLNGNGVTFTVPAGAATVVNFSLPAINLVCVGGGGVTSQLELGEASIKADRSFTSRATQAGVINGANVQITYFVTGTFQGVDASGAPTAAGVYREDITFASPARTCTSNDQSWTTARTR